MRVPSLPILIDEFPASPTLTPPSCRGSGSCDESCIPAGMEVFFLTHFHTDHMKGLSSSWTTGLIVTSTLTRQLLLNKFEGLRGRVLGLPYWYRAPVLSTVPGATTASGAASDALTVYVTLIPSFHIPGSAMIYLESPFGMTYLHTGDFKYTHAVSRLPPLRSFFQSHRVDHLYLDDTWLHLGQAELTSWGSHEDSIDDHASGVRVLSKLLDADQVEEALEAIGRRMDQQRRLYMEWKHQQETQSFTSPSDGSNGSAAAQRRLPFVVRVYLHNQFGKEMLIQRLAQRLCTRALIDDVRYARLVTVVEMLDEEREDIAAFDGRVNPSNTSPATGIPSPAAVTAVPPPLSVEEVMWRAAGGEAAQYPYKLEYFVSFSQAQRLLQAHQEAMESPQSCPSAKEKMAEGGMQTSPTYSGPAKQGAMHYTYEPPLVEVVSSRAFISPAALQTASEARAGTPYYGVVISGWARLQSESQGPPASGQVWHVPTTLHCTPQEIINFVAPLRPLSVTPLHYRASRGVVVMQRLGPFLRTPFVNRHDAGWVVLPRSDAVNSLGAMDFNTRWMPYLPAHLLHQDSCCGPVALAVLFPSKPCNADDTAGLDSLRRKRRRGFRIAPEHPSDENYTFPRKFPVALSDTSASGQSSSGIAVSTPHLVDASSKGEILNVLLSRPPETARISQGVTRCPEELCSATGQCCAFSSCEVRLRLPRPLQTPSPSCSKVPPVRCGSLEKDPHEGAKRDTDARNMRSLLQDLGKGNQIGDQRGENVRCEKTVVGDISSQESRTSCDVPSLSTIADHFFC